MSLLLAEIDRVEARIGWRNLRVLVRMTGGLGNQLFQYALALHLADLGAQVCLDILSYHNDIFRRRFSLEFLPQRLQVVGHHRPRPYPLPQIEQPQALPSGWDFLADPKDNPFVGSRDQILTDTDSGWADRMIDSHSEYWTFQGYWQSWPLVSRVGVLRSDLDQIRAHWQLPEQYSQLESDRAAMVHVRRNFDRAADGQMAVKGLHWELPVSYYCRQLQKIRRLCPNYRAFVFTNDPDWCCRYLMPLVGSDSDLIAEYRHADWFDLLMMSRCKYQLIANSTFSWWSGWLSRGQVFAPRVWLDSEKVPDASTPLDGWQQAYAGSGWVLG
ncbi:MAG: alpha-1,2-fucosyltransferase [Gammaproteobacteria bacterium]